MVLCSSCSISLDPDERVLHVKSEWHVYNLKRVVANLPPISEELFNQKKQFFSEPITKIEKKSYCEACKSSFINSRSYEAHLKSKKHILNAHSGKKESTSASEAANIPNSSKHSILETSDEMNKAPQSLPLGSCIFCDRRLSTCPSELRTEEQKQLLAKRVLAHMLDVHGFVLPYEHKLVDAAGLLIELGRVVGEERACLACGRQFYGRKFQSTANHLHSDSRVALNAVRSHMLSKPGHMRLWCGEEDPIQVALKIAQHEEEHSDSQTPPAVALAGGELFSRFYDKSIVSPSFILPNTDNDVYEVRLPSGAILGHRNMASVYRQHLSATPLGITQSVHRTLLVSAEGRRQPTSNVLMTSHTGPPSKSPTMSVSAQTRTTDRHYHESKRFWELSTGVQGNLVYRSRLRRQY
ncbi:pre-60S factor REI1 [Paragonimus westermani]|uniref:Pre-60S factor REI1 n=1 Tax=Paragonimus westermani TaxID=34504 RepID=A0A5J4NDD1_9TREM|nr:pre-60S factor REI1 [Paragonimus westermani]